MEIHITKQNIETYRTQARPEVIKVVWDDGLLDGLVLRNFPNMRNLVCKSRQESLHALRGCSELRRLHINNQSIQTLEGLEDCTQLQHLTIINCWYRASKGYVGLTSLKGIENCKQLRSFRCSTMGITSLDGLEACTLLEELDCSYNKIETLEPLSACTRLTKIQCQFNSIKDLGGLRNAVLLKYLRCYFNSLSTLAGLENCTNLCKLKCGNNRLVSLTGLPQGSRLKMLSCYWNRLKNLEGLEVCKELRELRVHDNELVTLAGIGNCKQLWKLTCSGNRLTTLMGIEACVLLRHLSCGKNQLTDLEGTQSCQRLYRLDCSRNSITSLEPIITLRLLRALTTSFNPLTAHPLPVQLFLTRYEDMRSMKKSRSIYTDHENINNERIKSSIKKSVRSLKLDSKPNFEPTMLYGSGLSSEAIGILVAQCDNSGMRYSLHGLTFKELLGYVWQRIEKSEYKAELVRILGLQVTYSRFRCFAGKFANTLLTLAGFYDDIRVEISDNDRISAIVIVAGTKMERYNTDRHRELALKQLLEAGYDELTVKSWIDAIY